MADKPKIVTRVAPSPTGLFHVGTARTALFNYLFARKYGGKFILRIEDTDKTRSEKQYEEDIINGLKWLGLDWDEFYRQSERTEIYKKYLQKLLDDGKAYLDGSAIRFNLRGSTSETHLEVQPLSGHRKVSFEDVIRGRIEMAVDDVGDFVIAKDLETPLFHFTVVVDDFDMGVTHVIRGEDHISNTPRHVLLQEALGFNIPQYAHLPLILGTDRSKLSKRHGAVSVNEYRKEGYLPEAIVNFLAFIGWNPGDEREIFSLAELVKEFSLERIQKSAGVFNIERLNWYNKEYIKKTPVDTLAVALTDYLLPEWKKVAKENRELWLRVVNLEKDRIEKFSDIKEGIGYFFQKPEYEKELLLWKKEPDSAKAKKHLKEVVKLLDTVDENNFEADKIKEAVWNFTEKEGRGNVLWPFRVALTGLEKSPDPFAVASIIGKKETLDRLKNAAEKI